MSAFGGAIEFLDKLGVYDVVLPFLLVFTLMYAFMEKTRIFGVETFYAEGDNYREKGFKATRKNLNAMVSFVVAFFVIASTQLVAIINQALAHMVLLLILIFCFLLVVGSFHKQTEEGFYLKKGWKTLFMVISFVALLFIFLNALGWLEPIYEWVTSVWDSEAIASVVLILIIVGFIAWVTNDSSGKPKKTDSEDD